MSEIKLPAERRTAFGKGAARKIRRDHKIPAVLYGHGTDPVAIFLLGFFWKRATANAALAAALVTIPLGIGIKSMMPDVPFLDRMGWVFLIVVALMVLISLIDPKSKNNPKAMQLDASMFRMSPTFTIGMLLILGVLAALYTVFW